jgi:hypothetical protein
VKDLLLLAPVEEVKASSENDNILDSTESEIKRDTQEPVRENIVNTSDKDNDVKKDSDNGQRLSGVIPYNDNKTKQVQDGDDIEFPIHNKIIILDSDLNNNLIQQPSEVYNSDLRTYHIDDGVLGNIVIKTRVVQSTKKLETEAFDNIETIVMQNFLWDNMEEYYKNEGKKLTQSASEPKVK